MRSNAVLIVWAAFGTVILLCCTLLVVVGKLDANVYLAAVVGPLIGAVAGIVGAKATTPSA